MSAKKVSEKEKNVVKDTKKDTQKKQTKKNIPPKKDKNKEIVDLNLQISTLNTSLKNLEQQNMILKLENQKNIMDFQAKAKDFQHKAQIEIDKVKAELEKKYQRDKEEMNKYGGQKMLENISSPLINLKKVIDHGKNHENNLVQRYVQGFEMLMHQLMESLHENGVTIINPQIGEKFDANIHEALEINDETKNQEQLILEVKQIGIKLYDHLIKPALVVISK